MTVVRIAGPVLFASAGNEPRLRRAERRARHAEWAQLYGCGWSHRRIASHYDVDHRAVGRAIDAHLNRQTPIRRSA